MTSATMIEALDTARTLFVLRDDRGTAIGTGTKEAMEVLAFIVNHSKTVEPVPPLSQPTREAIVRSALVF